ncbi:Serine/threonine kinase, partial [Coemansia erecta]
MLEELDHPFITNLRFSFQDTYAVYVATDLMGGGRLCDQLKGGQRRVVGEAVVRVWAAELASALQYLHTEHFIVHGRVDTRSVWIDMKGHVALGSFGGAHRMTDNNSYVEPNGSEGSPSLVPGADGYAGDWWGLGAVMF